MSDAPLAGLDRPPAETFAAARRALRTERRKLVDEQQAFEQFADRVGQLEPDRPSGHPRLLVNGRRDAGIERVRTAYRETVTSVPHYREDYGESLHRNVASELGEDIAAAVTNGASFSPGLQRSLVGASRETVRARGLVIDTIDEEATALDRGADRVLDLLDELATLRERPLERAGFDALRRTRERLDDLEERCESLTASRQETFRSHNRTAPLDVEDFGGYLYDDCASIHPVLSRLAALADAVDRTRRVVDRRLTEAR